MTEEQLKGIAAFLIEQWDEPLDEALRIQYWRDKCILVGRKLDPERWEPKGK